MPQLEAATVVTSNPFCVNGKELFCPAIVKSSGRTLDLD
jgi:hypothetical protein